MEIYKTHTNMRILKSHPLLKMVNSYIIDSPQPSNLSYYWNFGSLLSACLIIQILTGVTLAMHYNPSIIEAFNSVEHIMRDVNNGWLVRYIHSNTASAFFFLVYFHIGRGLYYGSYISPRTLVWAIGTIILIAMIATGFLGYVLPYGQMSLWGATVITNLMSAIPWLGQDIVEFIWGGFSVNNATLNRFFSLHFLLPFILAALALMHLISLHDTVGSGNALGVSANVDRIPFAPYYIFKDLITIFLLVLGLGLFVYFMPNILGDSENYVMANPMQTPPAIVPEWYLLPFYAVLRSIPNKLFGVIAMFSAILSLLAMPYADKARNRGNAFTPMIKIIFFAFIANFVILMILGAKHVETPFIEFGQSSTSIYFFYFILLIPIITYLANVLNKVLKDKISLLNLEGLKLKSLTIENFLALKYYDFINTNYKISQILIVLISISFIYKIGLFFGLDLSLLIINECYAEENDSNLEVSERQIRASTSLNEPLRMPLPNNCVNCDAKYNIIMRRWHDEGIIPKVHTPDCHPSCTATVRPDCEGHILGCTDPDGKLHRIHYHPSSADAHYYWVHDECHKGCPENKFNTTNNTNSSNGAGPSNGSNSSNGGNNTNSSNGGNTTNTTRNNS